MASRSMPAILPMMTNNLSACTDRNRCYSDSRLVEPHSMSLVSMDDLLDSRESMSLHSLTELIFGSGDNRMLLSVVRLYDPAILNSGDAISQMQDFALEEHDDNSESSLNRNTQTHDGHNDEQQPSSPAESTCMDRRLVLEPQETEPPIFSNMLSEDLVGDGADVIVLVRQQVDRCPIRPTLIYSKVQPGAGKVLEGSYTNCSYPSRPAEDVRPVGNTHPNDRGKPLESLSKAGGQFRKSFQRLCNKYICVCLYPEIIF